MSAPAAAAPRLSLGMALPGRFLASRAAPLVFGLLTALEIAFVWGSLDRVAIVHDEEAYLLQSKIFASGHWTAPARPLPEFFEQYHVLVTPVYAGKYPPGHSILMAPGNWVGMPGLVPVLLAGIAGALLFLLARRFANPWVALLTWAIWTTAPGNLRFLPAYMSQNTTIVLWLFGWWALAEWLEGKGAAWLAALSACVAWGVLARPFTTVGYAAAAGVLVLREVVRRRRWRDAGLALVPAALILAIIPLWSLQTTGSAGLTPYALYSKIYFPYQRPGFGLPAEVTPLRELPPDMQRYGNGYIAMHAAHTVAAVPKALAQRLRGIADDTWGPRRWPLALFVFLGLLVLPAAGWFGLATGTLSILCHIPFSHPWNWSLYYLELQAPLAFAGALGVWGVLCAAAARPRPARREVARAVSSGAALGAVLLLLAVARPWTGELVRARDLVNLRAAYHDYFRQVVAAIPESRAILFVRYGPRHNEHLSLIFNEPDLDRAKAWIARDRGADNARLVALAPDRVPYLYDEETHELTRWTAQGAAPAGGS